MNYIYKLFNLLLVLSIVLALHALVLWQILQQTPAKQEITAFKPIMVNLITLPKPSPIKAQTSPVVRKTIVKKTKPIKTTVKPTKKKLKKTKKPTIHQTRVAKPQQSATEIKSLTKTITPSQVSRDYPVGTANQKSVKNSNSWTTTTPSYQASYLHNPSPNYPRISRRRGEQGKVLLRVKVTKTGKATLIQIKKSSGFKRLDKAARKAVSQWDFIPATKGGETVSGWVIVPIVFKLS